MIIRIKKRALSNLAAAILLFALFTFLFFGSALESKLVSAANITNNTVKTRVNITNTPPNITLVTVEDSTTSPADEIDLVPNGQRLVSCNATIFDFNGADDINDSTVNATLYVQSIGRQGSADNNHRYLNESCNFCEDLTATTTRCECRFSLEYYSNDSSSWLCNVSVSDRGGTASSGRIYMNDTEISSTVTVNKLLAINTTLLLDYGNLSATQTSPEITHNVTNGGNINLNLTLRGFGGDNDSIDSPGNNVSMICELGNITIGNQRYSLGSDFTGTSFDNMFNLTNTTRRTNFTLFSRTEDLAYGDDRNSTFWRLYVPLTVAGVCNGTIIFGALETP